MTTLSEQFQDFFAAYDIVSKEKQKLIQLKANLNSSPKPEQVSEIAALEQKIADEQLLSEGLLNEAKTLRDSIAQYYQQTPLERYKGLPTTSQFLVNGELDVLAIHKNELLVASQVQKFKDIIAMQEALVSQYEKKIEKISEEIRKTSEIAKKNALNAEKEKLKAVLERIQQLSEVGPGLASPKPIGYEEEMSLLHSIDMLFFNPRSIDSSAPSPARVELPDAPDKLIAAMQQQINETQSSLSSMDAELKNRTEKRLEAMQELCSYYETYSANLEEAKPLKFPSHIKIKQIRYELPQKYRNTQGGITGGVVVPVVNNDMFPEQSFYVPKQANVHITCTNGAHLTVTPKSELILPSKQHFGIGKDFDNNAYQASVNLFAELYAQMHGPFTGIQRMTLNFTGVDNETSKEMKEAFIAALIEKECVKMENGKRTVDTLKLRNLYISAKNLEVGHVFKKFKDDQGLPREILNFDSTKKGRELGPFEKLRGRLSDDQKTRKVSEFIEQSIQQFREEIKENPDLSSFRNKILSAPYRKEEEQLKIAICIVASYDQYLPLSGDEKYEKAKEMIKAQLIERNKAEKHYDIEGGLRSFIEARIEDRKMCQARRPGLS